MMPIRTWSVFFLIVLGSWGGCATPPLPSPSLQPSAPFFSATSADTIQLAVVAAELDTMALNCAGENACDDQVQFSRALVSLFENREAARASFEQVINLHPSSPFAASSTLWLRLLDDEGGVSKPNDIQRRIMVDLTAQWIHEWIGHRQTVRSSQADVISVSQSAIMQSLQKQVQERDRRIAYLRAQLDALKVIDQEQLDRRKVRPSVSVVPKLESHR